MRGPLLARIGGGVISGLALLSAFPPFEQRWVAFVALVPLLLVLRGAPWHHGMAAGIAFGAVFFGVLLGWIAAFGLVAWVPLVGLMTAPLAVFGALASRAGVHGLAVRIGGLPLLWAGLEMLRGRWPLGGFTWGGLGYSQATGGPTAHLARLGGVYALGAAVCAINALVAEGLVARTPRGRAGLGAAAVALILLPGLAPIGLAGEQSGTFDVAAVQGNVPRDAFTGVARGGRRGPEDLVIIDNHERVTRQLLGQPPPDLVVWPENAFDRDPSRYPELFARATGLARELGAPFLIGAILEDGDRFRNSDLLVSVTGEVIARYDKIHLVPFGEYVPWGWVRRFVPILDREIPVDGRPGSTNAPLLTPAGRVAAVICFESTYPELVRDAVRAGGQVIVVSTNNASFGTSPAAAQHLAMSRLRAIEQGRAVVHAAIAGRSAIIRPDGTIIARAGLFTPALLRARVPTTDALTPYGRLGSWIEAALGLGALLVVTLAVWRRSAGP